MVKQFLWRTLLASVLTLTVATSTTPSASASAYTLTLVRIECVDKEDSWSNGRDEPYIEIDGVRVWEGTGFTNGTSQSTLGSFVINNSASVRLWEEDTAPDKDDAIGAAITVGSAQAGLGDRTITRIGNGGEYTLTYRVN